MDNVSINIFAINFGLFLASSIIVISFGIYYYQLRFLTEDIIEKNEDKTIFLQAKEAHRKNYYKFSKICIFIMILSFILSLIILLMNTFGNINYITCLYNFITVPIILVFLFYFIKYYSNIYPKEKEINSETYSIKKFFDYIFSLTAGLIIITSLIFILNSLLAIPLKRNIEANITNSCSYYTNSGKSSSIHYKISINPAILGQSELEVTSRLQQEAKADDKLRVTSKIGIFGMKFLCNHQIIKGLNKN